MSDAVIEENGRKVSPTEAFRAKLEAVMAGAQQQADDGAEDLILKAGFLSRDPNDMVTRERMAQLRGDKKANGWVAVNLWLDPSQVALVRARGRNKRIATAMGNIIHGLAVAPVPGQESDLDEQDDQHPEAAEPEIAERMKGTVVELWIMRDGSLDGCIRQGAARGPRLSSLAFGPLIGLWHLAQVSINQDDPAMVEAFLDRRFPDWREQGTPEAQAQAALAEPYEVLGIPTSSTLEEAKAAYRKAVQAAHPDKGGSRWLFQAVQGAWAAIQQAHTAQGEGGKEAPEDQEE